MSFTKTCPVCDKPLKQTVKGGKMVWVCKKPTCVNYMKTPR